MGRKRGRRGRRNIPRTQETPSQLWQRWDRMHGRSYGSISTSDALHKSTWVYASISYIADQIKGTPFIVVDVNGTPVDRPTDLGRFIDRPSPYADQNTSSKFRYAYIFELLLYGSVMRVFTDMRGFRPGFMTVQPRRHFMADWRWDELGRMVVVRWILSRLGQQHTFMPEHDIYHDALYNPLHDFEGLSPLTAALVSVGSDIDLREFLQRFFQNDASTGLIFSTDHPGFKQAQADAAEAAWDRRHAGLDNAFRTKFLGWGLKPHNVQSQFDADMMQVLTNLTREEIVSGIYKLPLDVFGAANRREGVVIGDRGGTQLSARETALVNVVMPWAMRYDEEFNRDVAWRFDPGLRAVHDFDNNPILESIRFDRAKAAVELIDRGMTLNQVISWLSLKIEQKPWGDEFWVENNRLPARIVLGMGDDARRIAVPDKGQDRQASESQPRGRLHAFDEGIEDLRREALHWYTRTIVRAAERPSVKEAARRDPLARRQAEGLTNRQRIGALLNGNGTQTGSLP